MQLKSNIKIGILFTLIVIIFIGGYFMFKTIKHNKQVFENELQSYIPADINSAIKINNNKQFNELLSFLDTDSIISLVENNLSYPLFLVKKDNDFTIIAKITSEQENKLKEVLRTQIFPFYQPKIEKFKEAELYFYPTLSNTFYCCTFYNGIFAGSFNYLSIQSIINTKESSSNFFSNETTIDSTQKTKSLYVANIYIKDKKNILSFNTQINNDSIILTGYIHSGLDKEYINFSNYKESDIAIFPTTFSTLEIINKYPFTSKECNKWFKLPSCIFNTSASYNNNVISIKLNTDKFTVYNYLNTQYYKSDGKNLSTNDFVFDGQRIYTISNKFAKKIFGNNIYIHFSFYENHFIYSNNKKLLIKYLLDSNNNIKNYFNQKNNTNSPYFVSFDNTIMLPLNIYSNKVAILNCNIKNITSYLDIENNKILIKIIANKKNN